MPLVGQEERGNARTESVVRRNAAPTPGDRMPWRMRPVGMELAPTELRGSAGEQVRSADEMIYAGLFLSALASATLLPGSSEATLLALLATGKGEPAVLVGMATAGNVLGSLINWLLGRFLFEFRDRQWFPIGPGAFHRAARWFRRYGLWSLLLSWLPLIGDPLTLVAGVLRVRLLPFLLLVSIGKAGRYLAVLALFAEMSG